MNALAIFLGMVGPWQIGLIVVVILLLFGGKKIPEMMRGLGSGIKEFKLADPIHHEKLFKIAEMNIKEIENKEQNLKKYEPLIKLYDKAEIINQIDS